MWPNLKRLSLERVTFEAGTFEDMIGGCPLIEILEIQFFYWDIMQTRSEQTKRCMHKQMKITNLHRLKQLKVGLKFDQPEYRNLKSLTLRHGNDHDLSIDDGWAHKFPQLEELSIEGYKNLRTFKVSSPSLKKIRLVDICQLKQAHYDVPNVTIMEYENYICYNSYGGLVFPKFSFNVVNPECNFRIKLGHKTDVDDSWLVELKEFVTNLEPSKTSMSVDFTGDVGNQNWYTGSSASPRAFLHGIFWMFKPQTITFRHKWLLDDEYYKIMYHIMVLRIDLAGLCNYQLSKLWNVKKITTLPHTFKHGIYSTNFSRKRTRYQLSQPLPNREKFLELLKESFDHMRCKETEHGGITVSFNLEWKNL
ncbi:OLC1v1019618C1 [Oldenlandia corymbosa var. corymbosa]|uniref:OLC1v1019618C1 n=1 Tax=Oldenlandia corymbosa var. corymbosa TaxID=529605 RepID=A0AAV1EEC2_OLDCO|nr:OLC1v1019618C1 [Oldenlandia corymbosa var. corymbosa]